LNAKGILALKVPDAVDKLISFKIPGTTFRNYDIMIFKFCPELLSGV
jgi:hypothetical protein